MSTSQTNPRHGEIWLVDFDPARGDEIQKTRPAIVLSLDSMGKLKLKLVAPLTGWQLDFSGNVWHMKLSPSHRNGLSRVSAVDLLQLRGVDISRFSNKLGELSEPEMEEVLARLGLVVGA